MYVKTTYLYIYTNYLSCYTICINYNNNMLYIIINNSIIKNTWSMFTILYYIILIYY